MTDTVLDLLTWALLGLLYLFFARVLWAVWTEVRTSEAPTATTATSTTATSRRAPQPTPAMAGTASPPVNSTDETIDLTDITAAAHRSDRAQRSRTPRGAVHEILLLAPRSHRGQRHTLDAEATITIGRAATCTLAFPEDTYVSGLHAQIRVHEGQPLIEDLGSTNGTFHNGNRLHGLALLHPGDRVQIGQTILEAR